MKKIYLLLTLTASVSAYAQTDKGSWMVGTGLTNANYISNFNSFGLSIHPQAGYFVSKELAIGGAINAGLNLRSGLYYFNYGIMPFSRYFFRPAARIRPFAEMGVGFNHAVTNDDALVLGKGTIQTKVGGGVTYFINNNVGLEGSLQLNHYFSERGVDLFMPSLNFGFQVFLKGKKHHNTPASDLEIETEN